MAVAKLQQVPVRVFTWLSLRAELWGSPANEKSEDKSHIQRNMSTGHPEVIGVRDFC